MLICKNCCNPVSGTQKFCPNCGAQSDLFVQVKKTVPINTGAEEAVSENTGAEEAVPENTGVEEAVPENTGAEEAVPENTGTEEAVPEDTVAEDTGAEEAVPEDTGAEEAVPEDTGVEEMVAASLETEETVQMSPETIISTDSQPNVRKKSRKPMIIGLAVILLALLAVSAFAMKDLLKTPKQRYIDAESRYFIGAFADIKAESDKAMAKVNKKYEQKMNLTVSPDLSAFSGGNSMLGAAVFSQIEEIIKSVSIESDTKIDNKNKAFISDFNIKLKGNVLINGTMAVDKDKELFKLPQFYGKTFVINFKELGKAYKNLGINSANMPDRILQTQDIIDVLKIDHAALKEEGKKYAGIYFNAIPDDQVKAESESLAIKDKKIACRKLTINVKKDDLIKLLENLANEAEKDEVLKQLVFDNVKNVVGLLKDAGYFSSEEVDIDTMFADSNYTEFFTAMKKEIQEMKDNLKLDQGIIMTLWVSNKGNIIKREIKSKVVEEGTSAGILYSGIAYHTDTLTVQNYSLKLEDTESAAEPRTFSMDISREREKAKKDSKEGSDKLLIAGEIKGSPMDNEKVNISINTKKKMVDDVLNGDTEFALDLGEFIISGRVKLINSENKKLREKTNRYDINLKINPSIASDDVIKGNIKLDLITKADVDVDLSSLLKEDYVELDKLDSTQMSEIQSEIQQNAIEFVQRNQSMFEEFLK